MVEGKFSMEVVWREFCYNLAAVVGFLWMAAAMAV